MIARFIGWNNDYSSSSFFLYRNNGQPLMCNMAVIIQDLVQADRGVAGVAFTRDPNTGDPDKITVAANYGSGEVSYGNNEKPISYYYEPHNKYKKTKKDFFWNNFWIYSSTKIFKYLVLLLLINF